MTSTEVPARRGRPRSAATDAAILDAALDELAETGFVSLRMESVAERAGVAKTTLYRRYPSSTELCIAALQSLKGALPEPPQGTARDQLAWSVHQMRATWAKPRFAAIMRRIAADADVAPQLYRDGRQRLIRPHVELMMRLLRRCVDEGLIRADADLELARYMLVTPISGTALAMAPQLTAAQVDEVVDTVLRGMAP